MATCRDCKLWDREKAKDKAGRIRRDRAALCLWVSTEAWPLSVNDFDNRRPKAGYMTAEEGLGCKRFIRNMPEPEAA